MDANPITPAGRPGAYLTPGQIAARLELRKVATVLGWIHSGELRAVNLSAGGKRATWRVAAADLEAFLAARRTVTPAARPTRRARPVAEVTEFF
jgi:excisionase family DNA binding protein